MKACKQRGSRIADQRMRVDVYEYSHKQRVNYRHRFEKFPDFFKPELRQGHKQKEQRTEVQRQNVQCKIFENVVIYLLCDFEKGYEHGYYFKRKRAVYGLCVFKREAQTHSGGY